MPFIETGRNLDDIAEEAPVPEGDYDLRIFGVKTGEAPSGRTTVRVSIAIEDPNFDNAMPMLHVLTIPKADDWEEDPELAARMMRSNKRFLAMFKIGYTADGWDTDDFEGSTTRAHLSQSTEDEQGNVYNRIRVPRLKV